MRHTSFATAIIAGLTSCMGSTAVQAIDIPRPVIPTVQVPKPQIPRPNIQRPNISIPKPNVPNPTVSRPQVNVHRPDVQRPSVPIQKPQVTVSVPKPIHSVSKPNATVSAPKPDVSVAVPKSNVNTLRPAVSVSPQSPAASAPKGPQISKGTADIAPSERTQTKTLASPPSAGTSAVTNSGAATVPTPDGPKDSATTAKVAPATTSSSPVGNHQPAVLQKSTSQSSGNSSNSSSTTLGTPSSTQKDAIQPQTVTGPNPAAQTANTPVAKSASSPARPESASSGSLPDLPRTGGAVVGQTYSYTTGYGQYHPECPNSVCTGIFRGELPASAKLDGGFGGYICPSCAPGIYSMPNVPGAYGMVYPTSGPQPVNNPQVTAPTIQTPTVPAGGRQPIYVQDANGIWHRSYWDAPPKDILANYGPLSEASKQPVLPYGFYYPNGPPPNAVFADDSNTNSSKGNNKPGDDSWPKRQANSDSPKSDNRQMAGAKQGSASDDKNGNSPTQNSQQAGQNNSAQDGQQQSRTASDDVSGSQKIASGSTILTDKDSQSGGVSSQTDKDPISKAKDMASDIKDGADFLDYVANLSSDPKQATKQTLQKLGDIGKDIGSEALKDLVANKTVNTLCSGCDQQTKNDLKPLVQNRVDDETRKVSSGSPSADPVSLGGLSQTLKQTVTNWFDKNVSEPIKNFK